MGGGVGKGKNYGKERSLHEDIKSLESFNLVMRQGTLFKSCICGFYKPGISSPCGPVAAFGARGVQSWGR